MQKRDIYHYVKALGHSMDYCMIAGDALLYNDDKKYSFGDIIVYKSSNTGDVVGHRFFFKIFSLYLIAGDNCCKYEIIYLKQVLGRGVMLVRGNNQRYNISEKTDVRTKYCRFLMIYILLAFLRFKLGLFKNLFCKIVGHRNRMQIKYMELCRF